MGVYLCNNIWKVNSHTKAYYPLSEDANDYSGNGYDLTMNGTGITYTTLSGVKCAKSAGSTNYLQSTTAVLPSGSASRTVSIWYAETLSNGNYEYIVCRGQASSGKTFALQTYAGKFRFSNNSSVSTSPTLTLNQWYSFIVTYSDNVKLYINGELITTSTSTINTTAVSSSYPLRLFNRNTNTTYPSYGYLSEVIIEDNAWSASDVSAYYNANKIKYGY